MRECEAIQMGCLLWISADLGLPKLAFWWACSAWPWQACFAPELSWQPNSFGALSIFVPQHGLLFHHPVWSSPVTAHLRDIIPPHAQHLAQASNFGPFSCGRASRIDSQKEPLGELLFKRD